MDGWEGAVPGVAGGIRVEHECAHRAAGAANRGPRRAGFHDCRNSAHPGLDADRARPVAVRFAARTEGGEGKVVAAFMETPEPAASPCSRPVPSFPSAPEWRRLEVPIQAFSGLRPLEVDWMTIEFPGRVGAGLVGGQRGTGVALRGGRRRALHLPAVGVHALHDGLGHAASARVGVDP